MMQPKKTKFAKFRKITLSGVAQTCNFVAYGSYGLVVEKNIKMTSKQIEAIRKVVSRAMNRNGALYIRVFPQLPRTKKPVGTRMGGGKSGVEEWIAPVNRGTVILEVDNVSKEVAVEALEKAATKISVPCHIIKRKFAFVDSIDN